MTRSRHAAFAAALGSALLAATAFAHAYKAGHLTINHPWARETAAGQAYGGGFMTVTNDGDTPDRLMAGATPAATELQLHKMTMEGMVMRMRQVTDGLVIPAHGMLELKPGSFHVMFIGLKHPLKLGSMVPATLRFEHAGTVHVAFLVEPAGATEPTDAGHVAH